MSPRDSLTHAMQAYQSRAEPERLYALAGKYWRIMLSVEVLIFIAAVAGGAYMLVMTFFNFNINKSPGAVPHSLNRNQLTQVIEGLAARKTLFQQLQAGAVPAADPSR
jgi:hypothetical protein